MVKRISKKQRRASQQELRVPLKPTLKYISPANDKQKQVFDSYRSNKHQLLVGCAGTGKTFLSLYLALNDVVNEISEYKKIIIIRSAVSGRAQGFLPGTEKQKMEVYESPYSAIVSELFGRQESYKNLKMTGVIQFESTSYLRGTTFSDAVVIVDEIQNCTFSELDTILTRFGHNCKVILCGDINQNDLYRKKNDVSGFSKFFEIIDKMNCFDTIEFGVNEIVRSGMVKQYLTMKYKLGY